MVVDLPAPLGPKKPNTCPFLRLKLTSLTAARPPYRRVNSIASTVKSLIKSHLLHSVMTCATKLNRWISFMQKVIVRLMDA